jgi:sulfite exporter TauE/SafE
MPAELNFASAILVGLLGSTHCIGMCGGIVGALNLGIGTDLSRRPKSLAAYHLAYNGGRIGSYVLVGLLAGSLGGGLVRLGVSPAAGKLLAAAFMIALGLYLANWWRGLAVLERLGYRLWRLIRPFTEKLLPVRSLPHAMLLGTLWGWLPCGLVYTVVAWSLTTGSPQDGALLMLGFGLGTLPSMLLAGNAMHYLGNWIRSPLMRTSAGIAIIVFGIYGGYSALSHHHPDHSVASVPVKLATSTFGATRAPAILRSVS